MPANGLVAAATSGVGTTEPFLPPPLELALALEVTI